MMFSFFATPVLSLALSFSQESAETDALPQEQGERALRLTAEQSAALRCSAAFALIAHGQSIENKDATKWPEMEPRGREFFVRTTASLMEDTGLNREEVSQRIANEAQSLIDNNQLETVMPACLLMLEASGL